MVDNWRGPPWGYYNFSVSTPLCSHGRRSSTSPCCNPSASKELDNTTLAWWIYHWFPPLEIHKIFFLPKPKAHLTTQVIHRRKLILIHPLMLTNYMRNITGHKQNWQLRHHQIWAKNHLAIKAKASIILWRSRLLIRKPFIRSKWVWDNRGGCEKVHSVNRGAT